MKRLIILTLAICATLSAEAQNTAPRVSRGAERTAPNQPGSANNDAANKPLSVRAQILNEQMTQEVGRARWTRTMIRELDLTREKNAPLYYPVQELNGSVNLFTAIFRLVSEGKVKVYKYTDGYESFEEENQLLFKEMLDNFELLYEEVPAGGGRPARYVINASDVPSAEVRAIYIKEAWYFDQNNSLFDVQIQALCPIALMMTDAGEQRMPMFWVKYEDVRPYIRSNYIMTSNLNNAKTFTIDDYFRRRLFDGEIVKTENLMNLALMQYCPEPDSLRAEQQRIEQQLRAFNDSLWIQPDTTIVLSKKDAKKLKKTASRSAGVTSTDSKTASAPKQKEPKAPKAEKSTPTRSIRRQ